MELSNRFRVFARGLFWLTTAAIGGMVLLLVVIAAMPDFAKSIFMSNAPDDLTILSTPSTGTIYLLLAAGCVAMGLQVFVLWNMRALLRIYSQGRALSAECGKHIARIGIGAIVMPFGWMFYDVASSYLLTRNNPQGQGEIMLGIESASLGLMLGGGVLLLVGAAMLEAARQADENRSFV